MFKVKSLAIIVSVLLLQACTGAAVKPNADQGNSQPEVDSSEQTGALSQPNSESVGKPAMNSMATGSNDSIAMRPANNADFERLEGRFNLAQEQLLGLITKTAQLQEQNHKMMMMMQSISSRLGQQQAPQDDGSDNSMMPDDYDTSAMDQVLEQLLTVADDLGAGTFSGEFRVSTVYTRTGDWVLIRFNRVTGETWLADGSQWVALDDSEILPSSEYYVTLVSAENDAKGYSAARIDRNSGRIWWLKQRSWQNYSK